VKLTTDEVDVWLIELSGQAESVQTCCHLLSPDERDRAGRFYFEEHRQRFIVARAAVRQILSRYGDLAPHELAFSYSARGKPELSAGLKECGIRFNLSHSSEVAILAVAQGQLVGVDIELVNPEFATQEIAERFFCPREANILRAMPSEERTEAFFPAGRERRRTLRHWEMDFPYP
jgi:4'-phosphopantetheinyl transferase